MLRPVQLYQLIIIRPLDDQTICDKNGHIWVFIYLYKKVIFFHFYNKYYLRLTEIRDKSTFVTFDVSIFF